MLHRVPMDPDPIYTTHGHFPMQRRAPGKHLSSPPFHPLKIPCPLRGDSEPGWGSETVARGAPLRTGACPGVVESGTVLVWSIPCSIHTYRTSFSQHFFSKSQNPSPGRSDAFRKPFPASTRQSLPMVASPGPGVVRGGEWLQYRARVVVIYVFTAPVRRFRRLCATTYHISVSGGGARRSKDGLSTGR